MLSVSNKIFSGIYQPTDSQSTCIAKTAGLLVGSYVVYRVTSHVIQSHQREKQNAANITKLYEIAQRQNDKILKLEGENLHLRKRVAKLENSSPSSPIRNVTAYPVDDSADTSAKLDQLYHTLSPISLPEANFSNSDSNSGSSFLNAFQAGVGHELGKQSVQTITKAKNLTETVLGFASWGISHFWG